MTNISDKKRGRKPDPARDEEILEVALNVLIETGYEGMTIDLVAAQAKAGKGTMYRRWPSKEKLVQDAVAHMKRKQVDVTNLPDTGSLRQDLLALFKPNSIAMVQRKIKILAALSHLNLEDSAQPGSEKAQTQPWIEVNKILIKRAIKRGEVADSVDVNLAAQIIPSMVAYRTLVLRQTFDKKFLIAIIDNVLCPALGIL